MRSKSIDKLSLASKAMVVIIAMVSCAFTSVAAAEKLKVGVENIPFLPFSEVADGEYRGLFRDSFEAFAKTQGFEVEWIPLPLNRLYSHFYHGKIDIKIPANPYWQQDIKKKRQLDIHYSDAIVEYIDGVMVKSSQKNQQLDELKTLGVVAGFTPWKYLDLIQSGKIKVKENPSITGILGQGVLGRVDGVYINIAVGEHYLNLNPRTRGKLTFHREWPYIKSSFHMASMAKHQGIVKAYNAFLKQEKAKQEKPESEKQHKSN